MFTLNKDELFKFVESSVYKKTEESNPITFVTLGNANNYEQLTFIADRDLDLTQFKKHQTVIPEVSITNYNGRPSVTLKSMQVV